MYRNTHEHLPSPPDNSHNPLLSWVIKNNSRTQKSNTGDIFDSILEFSRLDGFYCFASELFDHKRRVLITQRGIDGDNRMHFVEYQVPDVGILSVLHDKYCGLNNWKV